MKGAASESSVLALHRVLPPLRPTSPAQGADNASPFSALLDTGETEPKDRLKDRPEPATPRESAPHTNGFVRNKPAAKNPTKSATKSTESREPARGAQADGKAAAQDTKETRESETSETTEAAPEDAAAEAALSVAEATNAIVDTQAVTPEIVAAVLPVPVAPVAPETSGEAEDAVLAPAAAAALSPADAALAAEAAAEAEKPAVTKPAAPEQKGEEKLEKAQAQGAAQSVDAKPAAEGKDQQESKQDEKHAAQADAKDAKKAPDAEIRPEAPRAETAAPPARAGAEHNLSLTAAGQQAHAPLQAAAVVQSPAAAGTPIPVMGLAVEIAAQSGAGKNRFEIRLDPPELGRINVRLDMDNNGNVTSHLIVDRVETLDMLRRDAPQLERALEQAGLKTSENGLQFSLRDQSPQNQNQDQSNSRAARLVIPDADIPESAQRQYGRLSGLGGGLDIRV